MRLNLRTALVSALTLGVVVWPAHLAMAQTRPRIRPVVPASSTVRTIGEVDPTAQIDIVVTNSLSVPLGVGFAGGANLEVVPGETDKVSFTTVPVNLFLYPLVSEVSTRSNVTIEDNTINVEVVRIDSLAPGDASLNVDGAGTVYIY
ncbi:MAG: hypothetical protein HC929_14875 [Leptolyngbyaceae cyanobacterium SM2_5_2]|nr:hypothetical protein [Leptolyngbyaceae cyanobacterium SM2_5_2]